MFEFIGTNNTKSCSPSARSSRMQPAERLLAHILVKPTCALIDPGQVEDGRGELVKSHNLRFAGKPEISL